MIKIRSKGDWKVSYEKLKKLKRSDYKEILERYGQNGVAALSSATPIDSGKTANSWRYDITRTKDSYAINFYNDNNQNGVNIAIIIQYGHGTSNGAYIAGKDYINPAIQPLFDTMATAIWKEVIKR